ncbi:hypothetical protein RF679_17960 [Undibacterium cyanobacteriorum]|uniref:WYL domain-containing protein n=1 Tax=Undibacterium cyanobacteriorum TaxID=3073561 RepID=A0ABY9RJG5_9BURK|nr:hypothetical protein [Undibacterium sp. 20NA77.5]WMW80502.1 hypothetical protein RF679_17960 [Undibacterium sp. 20NA77.5]
MARYLPLFRLILAHEFFASDRELPLQIQATKACARQMEQEGLLLRSISNGIEVWNEVREFGDPAASLDFEFLVLSKDPYLETYTAWEVAKPIAYQIKPDEHGEATATNQGITAVTVAERDFGLSSFERQKMGIVFSVEMTQALHVESDREIQQYHIQLRSKEMHWKYYFSGALAKKKLEIIDLDAINSEPGCRFIPSSKIVTEDSLAFVSNVKLPMRSIPTQRFQLREEGANGRVLMRRLPNASVDKIGKEKGPDGQSLVVAEIYIHQ